MRAALLTLPLLFQPALAAVQSETVFFLQPDGVSYLLERSIHSNSPTHRFHLDKRIRLEDIRHISPARFEWDEQSSERVNSLSFDAGGFTVIYPGRFRSSELTRDSDGIHTYKSWDGRRDADGRYGYWYSPGQFDQFTYTWILPDNAELLRYRCNHDGSWTRRSNAVSFYAEKVNNLTFEIAYRIRPATAAVAAEPDRNNCPPMPQCPEAPARLAMTTPLIASPASASDSDSDRVADGDDLCPDTPPGARVDRVGCPLDTDHDGVPDGIDRCIDTREDTLVDDSGCATRP